MNMKNPKIDKNMSHSQIEFEQFSRTSHGTRTEEKQILVKAPPSVQRSTTYSPFYITTTTSTNTQHTAAVIFSFSFTPSVSDDAVL